MTGLDGRSPRFTAFKLWECQLSPEVEIMQHSWMSFLVLPLLASVGLATEPAQSIELPLQFDDFPVSEKYTGTPATVNLNTDANARRFHTVLRNGAKDGPNFAGHYTVVMWGCGTSCQGIAIVDAKTGAVYMTGLVAESGAKYRINSKLLVVNPAENTVGGYGNNSSSGLSSRYYVWEKNQLVEIRPPKSDR